MSESTRYRSIFIIEEIHDDFVNVLLSSWSTTQFLPVKKEKFPLELIDSIEIGKCYIITAKLANENPDNLDIEILEKAPIPNIDDLLG